MGLSVSESLLGLLAEAGASQIWGVTGDALNPLVEAVRVDDRFRWIGVRHEEHAGYAAYAQSELSGKIGVCAGTAGPGALHLINGLCNAKKEGGGVVAITGQVPQGQQGSDFHKEINLSKIYDEICDYQVVINSVEQMPRMAEIAIQKALNERVVTRIEIPFNIIGQTVPSQHFRHPLVQENSAILPPVSAIESAVKQINQGKRITLFCGIGCRGAEDEVLALAKAIGAPIAHTLRAKELFDGLSEQVVGMTGLIGAPSGYHAVWDSDVLIMLGTDFPYDEFIPDGHTIIQVDKKLENIGRRAPVTVGLVGTVKETLQALQPKISAKSHPNFLSGLQKMRDKGLKHLESQAALSRTDEPLHPQLFTKAVSDRAADDAFFAIDVGECTIWAARHLSMHGGRRMAGSFNHGSLGSGLPVALGAAGFDPSRQVWALCGDGGFGMSMNDFVTAVRYGWPIKVLVFNNSAFGFVKMEMEVSGLPSFPDATGLLNPNFAEYAKACGGDGVRVEHANEIVPAIEQALASEKPFIIDAIVSAGELSMPPKIHASQAWGYGVSKVKEGILGIKGDHDIWKLWRDEFRANLL